MSARHPTVTVEAELPVIVLLLAHALWDQRVAQRVWLTLRPEHYPNDHTRDLMALLATEPPPDGVSVFDYVRERVPDAAHVLTVAALVHHTTLEARPPKRLVQILLDAIPAEIQKASWCRPHVAGECAPR